ncbi:MAG: ATP-binding cassette domain-containing protein [Actinobacteria bacterium]|nr:ATP-binding cassette domain-containing protein [Actinomycetota bacterium]
MSDKKEKLLEIKELKKHFYITRGLLGRTKSTVYAVDGITLDIYKGETLGLVGESGCGKTTTGRVVIGLDDPTEGRVLYDSQDIQSHKKNDIKKLKKSMQIIFQDPYSSLDPRKTVGSIIEEPMEVHKIGDSLYRKNRAIELMETVGLQPEHLFRYPHEFSGGQRQRIGIARALSTDADFIVCDEPVSALDVSIQSQILNLLVDLQKKMQLTYLFIAHNLGVVRYISDRVAVMYLGKIIELGYTNDIFRNPIHPYTQALLSSVPDPDPRTAKGQQEVILEGEVPNPVNPPSGCRFHPRCRFAQDICSREVPDLLNYHKDKENNHLSACFFSENFIKDEN